MATTNTTQVKFVKVLELADFNDLTIEDGTIYFIVDAKKIYLDGVMYGFNDSDIDLTPFFKHDGTIPMTGNIVMGENSINEVYKLSANNELPGDDMVFIELIDDNKYDTGHLHKAINIRVQNAYYQFKEDGLELLGLKISGVRTIPTQEMTGSIDTVAVNLEVLKREVLAKRGVADGFASLGSDGKVPSAQLPSYVDDVKEYSDKASFPAPGESDKLYIDLSNNRVYRWGGSEYHNVSDGNAHLVIGTTSSTAHRGDHGTAAYTHSLRTSGNPHGVTKDDVELDKVQNYGIATTAEAKAGNSTTKYMTPQRTREAIETLAPKLTWTVVS